MKRKCGSKLEGRKRGRSAEDKSKKGEEEREDVRNEIERGRE